MPTLPAAWDQANFLGGEWSTFAQGRTDTPAYRTALALCSNALPVEEGAWTRRPASCHAAFANRGKISRLFSYRFSQHNPTYQAEISFDGSNSWLRLWAGPELYPDSVATISSWSTNTPAKFVTSTAQTWATNDDVVFYSPQTNNANNGNILLGRVFTLTKIDTTHFTIADAVSGATFASSAVNFDNTVTNKVARVWKYQLPFTSASDLANVRVVNTPNESNLTVNSGGVLLILCKGYQPTWVYMTNSPAEPAFPTGVTAAFATFTDGPYAVSTLGTVTAGAASGSITFTVTGGNLANGNNGWTSSDIGNPIRIYSTPALWASGTSYNAGDIVSYGSFPGLTFYVAQVANSATDPTTSATVWLPYTPQQFWTVGHITAVSSTSVCTLSIDGPPIYNTSNIITWLESAYSSYYGYPVNGVYTRGRLWLSALEEGKFDASYSNLPYNFAPSDFYGVVTDANAIDYQFPTVGNKPFSWMAEDPKGVLLGNIYGEYLVSAATPDTPITPTNIRSDEYSNYGCFAAETTRAGAPLIFIQRSQQAIMEFLPDTFSQRFSGNILNVNAQHLSTTFNRLDYQRAPTPIVWASDGTKFYGCTYRRLGTYINQEPKFMGWHKHSLSTGTTYDISQGTTGFDTIDALYMSVADGNGNYHVEYLDRIFGPERTTAFDAHFLDGSPGAGWGFGTSTTVRQLAGTDPAIHSGSAGLTFYGMAHLAGQTVTVFVAGLNCGTVVVGADGSVAISYQSDPEGKLTVAYLIANSGSAATMHNTGCNIDVNNSGQQRVVVPVSIGLPYLSEGQCVRPNDQQGAHVQTGPTLAETRRIVEYGLLTPMTGPLNVGSSSSATYPARLTAADRTTPLGASVMFSGVLWDQCNCDFGFDGQLYWSTNSPYPCTVSAAVSFIGTSERDTA